MCCPFCRTENDASAEVSHKCDRGLFALTHGYVVAASGEVLTAPGPGPGHVLQRLVETRGSARDPASGDRRPIRSEINRA
jgi:hypothetical protein